MITQEQFKRLFHYDPMTGIFKRLYTKKCVRKRNAADAGYQQINARGYKCVRVWVPGIGEYLAHRLAWLYMTGSFPKAQIDHINHDATDNRWKNLREATNQQNMKNKSISSYNKSGLTGVVWRDKRKKWSSQITVNYKQIHLGMFDNFLDAACARKCAEKIHNFHPNHGRSSS